MNYSWVVLIPPLIVFLAAFVTRNVILSLSLGISSGALIATQFQSFAALKLIKNHLEAQLTDPATAWVFCFLAALGVLVAFISHAGGTQAYGRFLKKSLHNARSAQMASIALSTLLCFDDFFSCITTGAIMTPITDHFKIPRVKLAFLIDSLAAPLAILIPVSSWIAMLIMQLSKAGISETIGPSIRIMADPFTIYLQTIPFIFYSFFIIGSAIFIVKKNISFGKMRQQEKIALQSGNLFGGKEPTKIAARQSQISNKGNLKDFFIPIALLFIGITGSLLYQGNWWLLGGSKSLFTALIDAPIFLSLAIGSLVALATSSAFFFIDGTFNKDMLKEGFQSGIKPMGHVIIILISAWSFSALMVNDLQSGVYLASILTGKVASWLLPAICFTIAATTSISVGSSWGTIAILTPLAVPTLLGFGHIPTPATLQELPLLLPLLGAIFAGAVAGDHICPLSSTTIMSSTSSGSYHFDHVATQIEYATPALATSFISYLICGFFAELYGPWIAVCFALPLGLLLAISILWLKNRNRTS